MNATKSSDSGYRCCDGTALRPLKRTKLEGLTRAAGAKWCNLQTVMGDHRLAGAHDELGAEAMVMVEVTFENDLIEVRRQPVRSQEAELTWIVLRAQGA